jgi:hypothetical protein
MRQRHPKKHVEEAIQYAESQGWRIETSNGHDWGIAYCPHSARDGCRFAIHSTPQVQETHARRFRSTVDKCPHGQRG